MGITERLSAKLPRWRFRFLRSRLAVLYAGTFALAMLGVSLALYIVVERNAENQVRSELVASGTVFDRLWDQRSAEMERAASLLAHDFGFRAAVATGDQHTADSALQNLQRRLHADMAFIIGIDGGVTGIADPAARRQAANLFPSLDAGQMRGMVNLRGRPRQVIAAPIMMPALGGWVVFAANIDAREMRSLERLSAIPLDAAVYQRQRNGRWVDASSGDRRGDAATSAFVTAALASDAAVEMAMRDGSAIALAKPLPAMAGAPATALVLQYPLSRALAPYRPLQVGIAVVGLVGLFCMMLVTLRISRSITRPISALDAAASRFAAGEPVEVLIEGEDELARLATSFNNMTRQIAERERRITHLAFNDVLVDLPNRALFHEHLEHQLRILDRRGGGLALLCLDLDNFKSINDTLGHPVGDDVLRHVARALVEVAPDCFIARLGGDEFVVVHALDSDRPDVETVARAILARVEQPARIDGHEIVTGVSIGIALTSTDGTDVETLLRNADLALYRAKEAGRHTWCFFEESLNARAQERRAIERDLRRALTNGEFELHFQPLLDIARNRVCSFEALLRWNHPERGQVSPVEFIPVAEETGLIVAIGAWVMREACRHAATWPEHVRVAVNVSPIQFHRAGLNQIILQALAASQLQPGRLEVEITESIFLEGLEDTLQLLHGLRAMGVRVALDDFGTGYSSLSYLQRFPFDKIKIDQSFVRDLLTRRGAIPIVRAIIELAKALDMETTAEGVENEEQLAVLRDHGCSSIQGYLFSKPVPASAVSGILDRIILAA